MPLYRFHLRGPDGLQRDEDGLTFPDLDAAYLEACRTIPDLAADLLRAGRDPMACAFVIVDAEDRTLLEVPFRERVRGARRQGPAGVPSMPTARCAIERAKRLTADVQALHAQLQDSLGRTRVLLSKFPGSGMAGL